ncbi:unnamed protein product [Schistocephalus solidus]|uniref:Cytosol aminopeptidase domain-containing protein n=1 Tax=Schistocephalus solidus TaxID=70667 RepID=A0A3P7CNL1_SCHSO|nr:unnamed protein product [Schistocephalus solidus]
MSANYDVVVFLNDDIFNLQDEFKKLGDALVQYNGIFAPTGKLNTDISDSRQIYDTAKEAAKLAFSLKLRKPLFVLGPLKSAEKANHTWMKADYPKLLMTLGALQGYYMPYIKRQLNYAQLTKYDVMGVVGADEEFLDIAGAIEMARMVHRDTCASDPERMPAPKIEEYYKREFKNDTVKAFYHKLDAEKWPMCAAVNRAVQGREKYEGRVINFEYQSDDFNEMTDDTVLLVGKGITYDTGGSELKTGGNMKYMRKDKCGATSIAGFFKALDLLKPKKFKAKAYLAFVRNGIGANAYVFDEIITTKAGIRTRIGAPDAEGRNVMTDMFYDAVQDAEKEKHPHIYTIATLTGAVGRAFKHFTKNTLRKDDYEVNRPQTDDEFDLLQFNNAPETSKYRGFQLPAGFMAVASGLDDPLTTRELRPDSFPKYDLLGCLNCSAEIVDIAAKIETARYVTRDICGTDEERMTAIAAHDYLKDAFKNSGLTVGEVKIDPNTYRMIDAVNRAVKGTKYDARYVTLEYTSSNQTAVDKELYFVGKGITFDTGGASIKTGGNMLFMHNDKCGAAGVAGFFKALDLLQPKTLNAHGKLAFVRNGLGADMYLVDEIIKSKAGIRSRIGSTDAEGRNVMVDLITDCIEDIKNRSGDNYTKAHIFTVATLTGHVGQAFGKLTAVMDNGPAKKSGEAFKLRDGGALIADIIEISNLRREDYEVCYPVSEYEDLQQRNTHANTIKYRGHQYPAAWMIMASGLSEVSHLFAY